jgi:hypothetical protein
MENRNLRGIAPLTCIMLGLKIEHVQEYEVNMWHRKLFCKFLSVLHADKDPILLNALPDVAAMPELAWACGWPP